MRIFGVDPGSATTGYGVIETSGSTTRWIDSGVIKTDAGLDLAGKLACIYDTLLELMRRHEPDWVCVEEAFYARNARTALVLGHARGVALLAGQKAGAQVAEFSARSIKQAVVGRGGATKEQVSYMVKTLLSPPKGHDQEDACDALAAALCGYGKIRSQQTLVEQ